MYVHEVFNALITDGGFKDLVETILAFYQTYL